MADGRLSHIGIAVLDLDKAISLYEKVLGMKPGPITEVPDQGVRVVMFESGATGGRAAETAIELIAAVSEKSPISRFLSKRGEGLHHICVYVDDLESKLAQLRAAGISVIDSEPRSGAKGNKIAFVHPSSTGGVLLELEEKPT